MRTMLAIALAGTALSGCASTGQKEAAILQCQAVGITQTDPQFDVCTRAYALQANQDSLEVSYHRALNHTYDSRRIGHAWHGY
jgi:hypothetical protein